MRPEEETVAGIQNWEPLLRNKLDTNKPSKPTKSSVSALTRPVCCSRTVKVSAEPPTLVQTVIFDSPKMQVAGSSR